MKKTKQGKLLLSVEKVRQLQNGQLDAVRGGQLPQCDDSASISNGGSCNPCTNGSCNISVVTR